MKPTVVVEFQPVGRRVEVPVGTTLLEAARALGDHLGEWGIRATCGGSGTCGQCLVEVVAGEVSGCDEQERELLLRVGAPPGGRLACRTTAEGPVKVALRRQGTSSRLQVAGTGRTVEPAPAVRSTDFSLPPPSLDDPRGDAERLAGQLGRGGPNGGCSGESALVFDHEVLRELPAALRSGGFTGCAVLRGREVIDVCPQRSDGRPRLLGMAVDLGTTKIAGYLIDLETGETLQTGAVLNPQISFGEDIISRLGYAAASPEGYARIRGAAVEALNGLAADLTHRAGRTPRDIRDMVVAGNTAMHHLLAGLGVSQLLVAPFVPAAAGPLDLKARELGLAIAPGAYVHLVPCVGGFVGGDHVAMILATGLDTYPGVALGIDVGTNTEIALARQGQITCCSCASGPAFEGGQISRGMRAMAGAIDRVWLDGGIVRYRVIGGGEPTGFCGAALIDLLACLVRTGAVANSGRLLVGRVPTPGSGGVQAAGPLEFPVGGVPLSQADIRQLQLAKAAIRSGIEALLQSAGLSPDEVERVYVAGAFGMALDPVSAVEIGMFPAWKREVFSGVGNAAGVGACLCLTSVAERRRAAGIARAARYLELGALPGYQRLFLSSLDFPAGAP